MYTRVQSQGTSQASPMNRHTGAQERECPRGLGSAVPTKHLTSLRQTTEATHFDTKYPALPLRCASTPRTQRRDPRGQSRVASQRDNAASMPSSPPLPEGAPQYRSSTSPHRFLRPLIAHLERSVLYPQRNRQPVLQRGGRAVRRVAVVHTQPLEQPRRRQRPADPPAFCNVPGQKTKSKNCASQVRVAFSLYRTFRKVSRENKNYHHYVVQFVRGAGGWGGG